VPEDYSYALVGHPNRKYLWILSREKTMDEAQFNQLVAKAKEMGFPTAHLERTNQSCGQE
jgi:apolipoprotein D and lipocalin family protein